MEVLGCITSLVLELVLLVDFMLPCLAEYRQCTGILPTDLIEEAIPKLAKLPQGVSVFYDVRSHVHALKFTDDSTDIRVSSKDLFQNCNIFPEEFSIFFVIKHKRTFNKHECVLHVGNKKTTTVSIMLSKNSINFIYDNIKIKFRHNILRDNHWHTIGFSVSARDIVMITDCRLTQRKRIQRKFPANISSKNTTFQLASCRPNFGIVKLTQYARACSWYGGCISRGRSLTAKLMKQGYKKDKLKIYGRKFYGPYTEILQSYYVSLTEYHSRPEGLLKDLIFVPGADASRRACPPRIPRHIHMDNRLPALPDLYGLARPGPNWEDCTWMDVGNIAYDLHSKSLRVCVNGIWQQVNVNLKGKEQPKRLDYLEFYQDVITPGASIDVEVFRIPGEGLFAVFANSGKRRKNISGVYKWVNKAMVMYQKLRTDAAQAWQFFNIGNHFFLAVANYGQVAGEACNSTIYKWQRRKKKFKEYQSIVTVTARDFEYFERDGNHYLAVANHAEGESQVTDSIIFEWDSQNMKFQEHQRILTTGAYDWTYFFAEGYHFLALAQAFNGLTTLIDSRIYVYKDDMFYLFQTMETNGATDMEVFTIKDTTYLVVANAYNYGPQNFANRRTHYTNSTIYRLNTEKKAFERYQTLPTFSAVDWEFFTIGDDYFLVVSNAQNGGHEEERQSIIYRWQGMDRFVPVHRLTILANTDWEIFNDSGDIYFLYTNAKGKNSQILKAKYIQS